MSRLYTSIFGDVFISLVSGTICTLSFRTHRRILLELFNRKRVVTFSDNKKSACWTRHPETNRSKCESSQFSCPNPNCRSVFTWKRNLTSHLRYQCGQLPRFKCPYCYYICKVKPDIRKHIRAKHQDYAVYVIDIFQQSETPMNPLLTHNL